eukprot:CAMPEP_0197394980 /NCGR_PEP_ID=MMETSP1165-20131217/6271_1 /TAXON_ID=284809 /ORGANISM="Chrysocystis fragilis, Strain CCMP3189" /LENGTH=132 /DNA_ID=CAMNT_0042920723 /DNA_START=80 /DNA_END=478 /DNA_ORIENTATION=+
MASDAGVVRKRFDAILGPPLGPYSPVVVHANSLYFSGVTAFDTPAQGQAIEMQVVEIFRKIAAVAEAEGTSLRNLVKVTLFVSDLTRISELRKALYDIYGDDIPASSLIQVAALFSPEVTIEVEAIVALAKK